MTTETQYLQLNETELYELIDKEIHDKQSNAFPASTKELTEKGRRWFESKFQLLKDSICPYKESILNESDESKAFIETVDLISKLTLGIAPAKLAALLIKIGIKHLCK